MICLRKHLKHPQHHWPKDLFYQRRKRVLFATVQADHFVLHETLKARLGVNAVKMVQGKMDQPLTGRALGLHCRQAAGCHPLYHRFKSGVIERRLAVEVVVEQCFVDASGLGDLVSARPRQPVGAELADGSVENPGACLVGSFALRASWRSGCHFLTNQLVN
jgi:hypothetical protein